MRRRLFNLVTAASLLLCVAVGGLWVRSLGHFEQFHIRYARWPKPEEGRRVYVIVSWYSNTLRLSVIDSAVVAAHFRDWSGDRLNHFRQRRPPGLHFAFDGEDVTREMNGYRPGFAAHFYPDTDRPPAYGDQYVLAVRPWLPTLLLAVLPALWLHGFIKTRRARRRGLCPRCGYDLCATPDRCPECGHVSEPRCEPPNDSPVRTAATEEAAP